MICDEASPSSCNSCQLGPAWPDSTLRPVGVGQPCVDRGTRLLDRPSDRELQAVQAHAVPHLVQRMYHRRPSASKSPARHFGRTGLGGIAVPVLDVAGFLLLATLAWVSQVARAASTRAARN
jgi:hypothetical protein